MSTKKSKVVVLTLILIFVVPMLAAWLAFSQGIFLGSTVNRGTLINPPFAITTLNLINETGQAVNLNSMKGKWWLFYITPTPSDALSQQNLYYMRQIRQATGKDIERVNRAIVTLSSNTALDNTLHGQFPGTDHFIISQSKFDLLKASLPKKLALEKSSLYLVDPLGNVMMVYDPNAKPKGILKDLKHVLKVSQIG